MPRIDIFNIEPSKIDKTLKGKYILLYGAPKTGKSTFGSKLPRSLFLKFEEGTNALNNIRGVSMFTWADVKDVLISLRKPQAKEMYDTIVVDTVGLAFSLCERFICQQNQVEQLKDIGYGGGYTKLKQEFSEVWREIALLGFGILFISHEKTYDTGLVTAEGEPVTGVKPDLTTTALNIISAQVDLICYLKANMKDDGTTERFLYTRATPRIFAGARYKYIAPKIPFGDNGYQELVNAIGDAIDQAVVQDGAQVSETHERTAIQVRTFNEVMTEAKDIWKQLVEKAQTLPEDESENFANRMNGIVRKTFGRDMKLAQATDSQQDLVELCIEELKALL